MGVLAGGVGTGYTKPELADVTDGIAGTDLDG